MSKEPNISPDQSLSNNTAFGLSRTEAYRQVANDPKNVAEAQRITIQRNERSEKRVGIFAGALVSSFLLQAGVQFMNPDHRDQNMEYEVAVKRYHMATRAANWASGGALGMAYLISIGGMYRQVRIDRKYKASITEQAKNLQNNKMDMPF